MLLPTSLCPARSASLLRSFRSATPRKNLSVKKSYLLDDDWSLFDFPFLFCEAHEKEIGKFLLVRPVGFPPKELVPGGDGTHVRIHIRVFRCARNPDETCARVIFTQRAGVLPARYIRAPRLYNWENLRLCDTPSESFITVFFSFRSFHFTPPRGSPTISRPCRQEKK